MNLLRWITLTLLVLAVIAWFMIPRMDRYNPAGAERLAGLTAPVRIVRDEKGMPYVMAETFEDAIRGQGFVTAQDRLFQMQMMRLLSQGRLSELIGEPGIGMDTLVHLLDIPALAQRQTNLLTAEERNFYQSYADGVNAYVAARPGELPLPLRGNPPAPWTLEELIGVQIFSYWGSTTNWREELLSQSLIDHLGVTKAAEISQITVNADDEEIAHAASDYYYQSLSPDLAYQSLSAGHADELFQSLPAPDYSGSNCWVTGSGKSAGGLPIVASDPHIDARRLPGFWHPIGLITPGWRAVGGAVAGSPGMGIGRTSGMAWGVTNGYGDMVDLYVEQPDPANPGSYLEGSNSTPFQVRRVTLRIKDEGSDSGFREQALTIRATARGPIISDHGMGVASGKLLSLRWAAPEFFGERMSMRDLLLADSAESAVDAIGLAAVPLTYVVADYQGNIARTGSGFIPRRVHGDGAAPIPVLDASDSWSGRIPAEEMPRVSNPEQGWLGSANHRIVPADYPYEYSTYFAHSWRYRRIREQMAAIDTWSTADHWRLQLDSKNMLAVRLAPLLAEVLLRQEDTRPLGELLQNWDYRDDAQRPEPLIFQSLLRHYARHVVADELGTGLAAQYLNDYYYWHERIARITLENNSPWLDDVNTPEAETREDLMQRAGRDTLAELVPAHGSDPTAWRWGDTHTITFAHPLVPGDRAANWIGGGTHPMHGSGETLNRAAYKYAEPYVTTFFASMRLVMDLSDPDKIEAHIPGGTSERLFDPRLKDRLPDWLSGTPNYWWFSDAAIEEHAVSELLLQP